MKVFVKISHLSVLAAWGVTVLSCSSKTVQPLDAAAMAKEKLHQTEWNGDPRVERQSRHQPFVGTKGMIVADDREAAEWGVKILKSGGNAVDAAVATGFALAVTRPHFGSLGGGGFMVYCPHPEGNGKIPDCVIVDYREQAPEGATRNLYVREGKVRTDLSQNGALASGVPGVPAGLLLALEKFGKLPRKKILSRPIEIAKSGIRFSSYTELAATERWSSLNDEAKKIFGCSREKGLLPDAPCSPGTRVTQSDLAKVLEEISRKGKNGFYQGWVAQKIVTGLQGAGGIMTLKDLASYQPKIRVPVVGEFRDYQVVSMPPPSAGGTLLLQMLGYVERAERAGALVEGYGAAKPIHALSYAMALAFADRAEYFGDPDYVKIPMERLLSQTYLDQRWATFNPERMVLPPAGRAVSGPSEGQQTTHFSVVDRDGNAVAVTTTVNDNFGSGFVPPGTGIVMNNEMDDFSLQPGTPNLFGLVGNEANAIAPGKRPLSSMSPTVVRDRSGNVRIVIGAAGGPRITTSVFLSLVNRLKFGMSLPDAVSASRFHHQWKPSVLRLDQNGFSEDTRAQLNRLGYALEEVSGLGKIHALERFRNGRVWGVPDVRGEGAAVGEE